MTNAKIIPPYVEILDGDERAAAKLIFERIVGNVDWDGRPVPGFELPVRRLVYQYGGFDSVDDEFIHALDRAAAAIGEDEFFVVEAGESADVLRVDRATAMSAFATDDWIELDDLAGGALDPDWDPRVSRVLSPEFTWDWAVYSISGSWIFLCVDGGDTSALAGTAEFMATFIDVWPSAAWHAVEWILGDGDITLDHTEIRDENASLWRRLRGKVMIENPDRYSNSSCERYLEQFYSKLVARELYGIASRVTDLDELVPITKGMNDSEIFNEEGPLGDILAGLYDKDELANMTMVDGTPDERLAKLISRDPSVAIRLREIWDGK